MSSAKSKCLMFAAACMALLPVTGFAQAQKPFQRMDVFALQWVSNPQISPDGRHVVYERNAMDVMRDGKTSRLWLIGTDGKSNLPLTGRDVDESGAKWSPDGSRIAYSSSTDDGSEIFVYWIDSGKSTRLTQLDRSPGALSWSPDGEHIAFSMLVPEKPPVLVEAPAKPDGAEWADAPRVTTQIPALLRGHGWWRSRSGKASVARRGR